ncbi:DNA mismatch repair protein Mlh1 [Anopheles nili]|uniref:DNA mismatch repair protein Mlh1 n=1 Tax=Anopheles nili TaxID=185578 RepID=UPI00237B4D5D|nr:DNA mismatch repair protein Mlh1 [Anopheles nili]
MEPGVIRKLDQVVVNRIAAGEIIQRPANALKEMIENSLDAKATSIQITVKGGGLRTLQIQDNGTGIRRSDLEIVCERFTTSKLQSFDDLSSISTYGFRGEALASISHVAHLTIVTKTKSEKCAYKACYADGKLKGDVKPIAGNQGTQIIVEELFHNVPMRKQALKTPNEEFQRISDVVGKYAVHNPHACFVLKKFGETAASIRTQPNTTVANNIGIIYGSTISKALVPVEVKDNILQLTVDGFVTNVNFSLKKGISLMFINHRAVECNTLKKAIDEIYSIYLPKGSSPFIYLSIGLNPNNVDVNVHPTKHEVHFLHEEQIVEKVKLAVERALLGGNAARSYTQALLPGAGNPLDTTKSNESMAGGDEKPRLDYKFVRTSHSEQKLDKFFNISGSSNQPASSSLDNPAAEVTEPKITQPSPVRKKKAVKRETRLTSIHNLRQQVESNGDENLRKIFRELTFIGTIDRNQVLIQYDTKMFLTQTQPLVIELFYQLLLFNFGNFERFTLSEPLELKRLAQLALTDPESGYTEEDGTVEELTNCIVNILVKKAPLLREYFSLSIRPDGFLESLPRLLDNYIPSVVFLPMYILRLATEVEWDEEEDCFRTFSRETATFFARVALTKPEKEYRWELEHVIYPAIRNYLIPPKEHSKNGCLLQLASLPELYRVFERC